MIEVNDLCKSYGNTASYVVKNINMKVERGSIHGLIGHNGSGKTTIIKCLTGIFPPDAGEILIDGEPVYNNVKIKSKIGYVADTNQMFRGYNIGKIAKFYREVYPDFVMNDFVGLSNVFGVNPNKKVGQMSKGQQMRASFVLNLARHPEVMILDEPTAGLDAMAKKKLLDYLVNSVENTDMTVLISSHNLDELEKICDAVTIINRGEVQIEDALDELKEQVVKYQVIFPSGAPNELYHRKDICHLSSVGSVYTLVLEERNPQFEEEMEALGAAFVEEMPVGLEECFIYMNQSRKYGGGWNE